ncbi:N-acetyl sugar amidotransferase [Gammaproteobacteria bacterium]|nr:N-acetyl sugar amidotransferase [Gammaproteobacteria bacterium]
MDTKLEAYYGLPNKVKFCKKCSISNQRPNSTVEMKNKNKKKETISFDEHGVCSACRFSSDKENIDWQEREEKLFELLQSYRSSDGSYDVLVPSSGGKDSAFAAHVLKYKYKMNPLAITWAPNMFTRAGWNNFNNLTRIGGIDSFLYTPNGKLHSYLTKLAFRNLGHPFQPFIHGQKIIGPKMAKKFGIKLIMYGENQAEYGNPLEDNQNPFMRPDFFTINNPLDMILGGEKVETIINTTEFVLNDFSPYIPPTPGEVENSDIKVTFLGYFEKWDPQECYYYAVDNTGFMPSYERSIGTYSRYTEIDDKIVPFHFYMTYIKFGIGRATYDSAQEVRNGKITRDEALNLVDKFDGEFPQKYFKEFCEYINITEKEFFEIVDSFRSPHLWGKFNNEWKLRHTVCGNGIDD